MKKPSKVAKSTSTYATKKAMKPAIPGSRDAGAKNTEFKSIAGKIFAERKDLLRKLAE